MGTVGLVRNDVAERFGIGKYGRIYGKMVDGGLLVTHRVIGVWIVSVLTIIIIRL